MEVKRRLEEGRLFVKAVNIVVKMGGMTREEKEDRCIGNESVEEWQNRIELIQYDVMKVVTDSWND